MKADEQLRCESASTISMPHTPALAISPVLFSPILTPMPGRDGHPVLRRPGELRLHPALAEVGSIHAIDELNDAARLSRHSLRNLFLLQLLTQFSLASVCGG
jgi:hypothetical protein